MLVRDAQREVRAVFAGGFWGQLVGAAIWLASAALGTWDSPRVAIYTVVIGGFFLFPLTLLMLRLTGRPVSAFRANPLGPLGAQTAFSLCCSMLLLIPVANFHLNLFYPALLVLLGAHYFPFTSLYGMRSFFALSIILVVSGIAITIYFPRSFSLGAWVGGIVLFIFSWILRAEAGSKARSALTPTEASN